MSLYALVGHESHELLTFGGKVLTHPSKTELEWIIGASARIVRLPRAVERDQTMAIRHHPGLASYTWPLQKGDFVR